MSLIVIYVYYEANLSEQKHNYKTLKHLQNAKPCQQEYYLYA